MGSRYVSDPGVWKSFYKNMMNGKFHPTQYRGRQSGGGIAGMYAKKPYMIPVNPHVSHEQDSNTVVGKHVTPVAAVEERAKSEMKEAIKEKSPHVPIKGRKRRRSVSSKGARRGVTSKSRERSRKELSKRHTKGKKKTGKRNRNPFAEESIFTSKKAKKW